MLQKLWYVPALSSLINYTGQDSPVQIPKVTMVNSHWINSFPNVKCLACDACFFQL